MKRRGLTARQQCPIAVQYEGQIVGEYCFDLLVEEKVIIEVKAVKQLIPEHEAQLLNYLKATGTEVGLLINFGPKPEGRRRVFTKSGNLLATDKGGRGG